MSIAPDLQKLARPIDSLTLDPANARRHPERNLEAIRASLATFGQRKPVVVQRKGMVVRAGNGTVQAAKALGWSEVAAVVIDEDNATASQFAIADNRTGELAEWDDQTLATLLDGMDEGTRETLAFDQEELAGLMRGLEPEGGEIEEDETPELPADPITKPGDLWTLGEHRLLCGDCRSPKDMAKLMAGAEIHVAITSPPYASQRKYDETTEFKPIHPDVYVDWFSAVQGNVANHLAADGSWFVNIKEHCEDGERSLYVKDLTLAHVRDWAWRFVDEFVWTHGGTPKAARQRFKNGWEPIFQFSKGRHKFRPNAVRHATDDVDAPKNMPPSAATVSAHQGHASAEYNRQMEQSIHARCNGMAYPSNVLSIGLNREALGHSAAYPAKPPAFLIKAYTDKADTVFDPFIGSGTTLIAAEQLGRQCYGMEISPAYCDVIVQRWETLTGREAQCQAAGHEQR